VSRFQQKNGAVQVPPRFYFLKSLIVLVLVGQALAIPPAGAVTGYQIVSRNPVHAYSGPGPSYDLVGALANGSSLEIVCQDFGAATRGSNIWDKLADGSWVSDYWTSTPSFNSFSPGIGQCSGAGWYTPQAPSREFAALSWAASQIGQSQQRGGLPWAWWCDRFVAHG
jgi:hypothetical protein